MPEKASASSCSVRTHAMKSPSRLTRPDRSLYLVNHQHYKPVQQAFWERKKEIQEEREWERDRKRESKVRSRKRFKHILERSRLSSISICEKRSPLFCFSLSFPHISAAVRCRFNLSWLSARVSALRVRCDQVTLPSWLECDSMLKRTTWGVN